MAYKIKALFFDIDGTLVSFKTHKMPDSAIKAIAMAKERGIKVFISTGRPRQLIDNIGEISHLVDGYITVNGAYCFDNGGIISFNPIPEVEVRKVLALADEMNFACMVVGENDLVMYNDNKKANRIFRQLLDVHGLNGTELIESVLMQPILQLTPIISRDDENLLMQSLLNCKSCRWHLDFTDITINKANKGMGLSAIISRHGIKREETMAFGDGENDISIIRNAGIGIAMGNSNESLKINADYITDSVDNDGIYNALQYFLFK